MKTKNLILIGAILLTLILYHRGAVKKQILKALNEQQVGFANLLEGRENTIANLRLNLKASHDLITKLRNENDSHLKSINSLSSLPAITSNPSIPAIPAIPSIPSLSSLPSLHARKKLRLGEKRDVCVESCSGNNENMNYFSCLENCARGKPTSASAALIAHHDANPTVVERNEKYNGASIQDFAKEVKIVEEDGLLEGTSFKLGLSNETMKFALRYMRKHGIPVKDPELVYKTSAWLIAADIYNYESPLMDLNLVSSSEGKGIIEKFATLPKSYLDMNRQNIINNYWLSSGSKIGLKHFWQRCVQKVNPNAFQATQCFAKLMLLYCMVKLCIGGPNGYWRSDLASPVS